MCNSIISSIKHITYCYYGSGDCIIITNRKNKRVSIMRYKKKYEKKSKTEDIFDIDMFEQLNHY